MIKYLLIFLLICNQVFAQTYEVSTGNLGINTAQPTSVLGVGGNAAIGGVTYTNAGSPPSNGLIVQGNTGIGSITPGQQLDVTGTVRMTGFNLSTNPSSGYVLTSNSVGVGTWMPSSGGGASEWALGPGGSDIYPTNSGNVGIGTNASPSANLTVQGTLAINNSGPSSLGAINGFQFDPANLNVSSPTFFINSNGNVGIFNSSPNSNLEVVGSTFMSNIGADALTFDANGTNFIHGYTTNGDSTLYIGGSTGINTIPTSPVLDIDVDTGNVGIGTAQAKQTLDVQGSVRMTGLVIPGNGVANGYCWTASGTGGNGGWASCGSGGGANPGGSATQLQYQVNGTTFGGVSGSSVDSNGNIGINSANPGQILDVTGTVRATNLVTKGGTSSQFVKGDGSLDSTSYGTGTVTAVSVASSNGFAGSSSGGATPALTLTTSITGPLKGNGTAISAATSSDIVGLFSTCSGTQYLGADGACHNSGGGSPGGGQNAVQYNNSGSLAGAENVFSFNGTNVGIGTTNGKETLDVEGTLSIAQFYGGVGIGTSMVAGFNSNGKLGALSVMNGNVGIGTWVPGAGLQVGATPWVLNGGGDAFITLTGVFEGNALNVNGTIGCEGLGSASCGIGNGTIATQASGSIATLVNSGSSAGTGLSISGSTGSGGSLILQTSNVTSSGGSVKIKGGNSATIATFTDGLNVGIGTTTPQQELDVWGTVSLTHAFQVSSAGNVGIGTFQNNSLISIGGDAPAHASASTGAVVCLGTAATGQACLGYCTSISTDTCGCSCI